MCQRKNFLVDMKDKNENCYIKHQDIIKIKEENNYHQLRLQNM